MMAPSHPVPGCTRILIMQTLPRLSCRRIERTLLIDGQLDKPEWHAAASADLLMYSGERPSFATSVRTLWHSDEFYVAFDCEDPEPTASMTRRDDPLFAEGNVVEMFIDPGAGGTRTFEFEINPLGTLMDLFYERLDLDWREAVKWNGQGARAAARIRRNALTGRPAGWTAELAVPFHNFHTAPRVPPKTGDVWRVNFYRYNTVSTLPGDHLELYAWSPTFEKQFNLPHRFGFLEFAELGGGGGGVTRPRTDGERCP